MPFRPFDIFREMEQLQHYLHSPQIYNGIIEPLHHLLSGGGPKVEVFDQGQTAKVVINVPGLSKDKKHLWSMRVIDQSLYIRGKWDQEQTAKQDGRQYYSEKRSEQFVRTIPLPFPVRRKPSEVEYKNGLLTVTLTRQHEKMDDGWVDLQF